MSNFISSLLAAVHLKRSSKRIPPTHTTAPPGEVRTTGTFARSATGTWAAPKMSDEEIAAEKALTNDEIGIDPGSRIEASENPFRHRIVVIGSSITHGVGAGRPGMAYPAQLERATGFEFINLGASGQCKMEQFFAHVAADCEADAFLFDSFSNPSAQQINERLDAFVATIRAAHPTTPLIFLQTEVRESRNFDEKIRKFEDDKRAASEAGMEKLLKADRNIYFINPGMPLGSDHEATVDGVHPSDLGFARMLEEIRPQIVRILKKYGIK